MPSHPRIGILGSLIKGLPDLWPRLNDEPAFGHFFDLTKNNLVISITNLMPGTLEALCFMLYAVKIFTQNNKIFQFGRRPQSNLDKSVPAFRFPPPASRFPPSAFRFPNPAYSFNSGLSGPKCFSITMGSVLDLFVIVTPALAAVSVTKYSSCVS